MKLPFSRSGAVLLLAVSMWIVSLLKIMLPTSGLAPPVFPTRPIEFSNILFLLSTTIVSSGYSLSLGIRHLKDSTPTFREGFRLRTQTRKLFTLIFSLLICTLSPIAYAYIYQQQNQNITQTIINLVGQAYFYVDNNTSDVDSSIDKGTHLNFTAQKYGPDSIFDTLKEQISENWWNVSYSYRRSINVTTGSSTPINGYAGYTVQVTLNTSSLVTAGKMMSNGNDLRIVFWNGSSWEELDRHIINMNTSSTEVRFQLQANISASTFDDDYYLFYGNQNPGSPPENRSNVYDYWDDFNDGSLDPTWTFSQIGGAVGSYSESGTVIRLNATNSGDLWGNSDNFLFLSTSRNYDFIAESYTSNWSGSQHTWSKMGGVQLRQSLEANSTNRIMSPVFSATGATNSYRLSTGGITAEQITGTQPKYNRLSRIGGTSRAWYSTDGVSWTELGSQISFSGGLSDPVSAGIHLAGSSSSNHWVEVDWFMVRRYVEPEPTTSLGNEEIVEWLGGWDNRVKITVDHTDIDSDLSNFPVLIYLSSSSGRSADDVSFVFDELQSDDNRKKIAVTTSDGTTECYVEIEKWDDASEKAWLWVKVPSINSIADTDLYLYYDADHADNTAYVGDPNSTTAENVWDTYFKHVSHMRDDPDTSSTRDSTSNDNDGTKYEAGGPAVTTDGNMDNAQYFDGGNDYINYPVMFTAGQSEVCVEFWMNRDTWVSGDTLYDAYYSVNLWQFSFLEGAFYTRDSSTGSSGSRDNDLAWSDPGTGWHYIALRYSVSGSIKAIYVDGSLSASTSTSIDTLTTDRDDERLGYPSDGSYYDGKIDEIRISTGTARTSAWIKASYESERDDLIDYGSEETQWLAGWNKRVGILIDYNDVDSSLFDFPVLIYLSMSSGRNNDDVSFVFDELQDDSNRKKIAVTTSDGITQCYVEIEKWDDANEQAWLWVKVPNIDNLADTELYLYYDADHADNSAYAGDPDSIPAQHVWESNFVMVQHLHDTSKKDGTYNDHLDSTSKDNDGEAENGVTMDAAGKINGADDFDGVDDYVEVPDSSSLDITDAVTIEAWIYSTDFKNQYQGIACKWDWSSTDPQRSYSLYLMDYTMPCVMTSEDGAYMDQLTSIEKLSNNTWYHLTGVSTGSKWILYINGEFDCEKVIVTTIHSGTAKFSIGASMKDGSVATDETFKGIIDEVRVSDTVRSAAWIKASYESGRDDLVDFGSEEKLSYELDLEVQWTSVDYDETNEFLCIYTGTLGSENLEVDVWTGSSWTTIISALQPSQWNNVTVSSYLTSSTFTIRFKGGTETDDTTQDNWNIDATLLHVWS